MGIVLGPNQYGKAENRVVRVYRDTDRHEIRDLNVSTSLRGDFAAAHIVGDQSAVLPTDTQKNTAFAFAKKHGVTSPEDYAIALGRRLLEATPAATERAGRGRGVRLGPDPGRRRRPRPRVRTPWRRGPHHRRRGDVRRRDRGVGPPGPGRAEVDRIGVQGLPGRRVHHSRRDRRPHPRHVADRAVAVRRGRPRLERGVRRHPAADCSTTFATTYSRALQETLYAMGTAVLEARARGRGDLVRRAQQAPLPGRPRAVRAREPGRGLRRRRPSLRPDRGHGARGRARDPGGVQRAARGRGARPAGHLPRRRRAGSTRCSRAARTPTRARCSRSGATPRSSTRPSSRRRSRGTPGSARRPAPVTTRRSRPASSPESTATTPTVADRLVDGNRAYEERFDRVFLIRAAGRDADEILAELERRLGNDDATERDETVEPAAPDRAAATRAGGDLMATLSTHVLDTSRGRPAAGIRVALQSPPAPTSARASPTPTAGSRRSGPSGSAPATTACGSTRPPTSPRSA